MLLDSQNLFSDNQLITLGTTNSQNIVKFGIGDISYLPLLIQVTNDFLNLDSLNIKILTSDNPEFSSSIELCQTSLAKNQLYQGAKFPIANMPKGNKGYIKLVYEGIGSQEETNGTITAGIVLNNDTSLEE